MSSSSRDPRPFTIRLSRRLVAALVMITAALGLVGVGVAGGARLAAPTAVAVVDYNKVLSSLEQQIALEAELNQLRVSLEAEGRTMVAEAEALVEQLRAFDARSQAGELDAAGEAEYARVRDEFRKKDLRIEAWKQRSARRLDWERSYALEELFNVVNTEIAAMANANGYDIVLANDSNIEIRANRRQPNAVGQLAAQMGQRRVLFAGRAADITQDLIDRLNNAWNAAR